MPGGTIVLMDGLVQAAADAGFGDDALLGVLAHEMGHVMRRRGTRMVVEQAGLLNREQRAVARLRPAGK